MKYDVKWDHMLWLDLETTGSEIEEDVIVEVAIIITNIGKMRRVMYFELLNNCLSNCCMG